MRNTLTSTTSTRIYIPVILILTFGVSADAVAADWSSKNSYNPDYGEFPPDNIDQRIQNSLDKYSSPTEESPPVSSTTETSNKTPLPSTSSQQYQAPAYGNYDRRGGYNSQQRNYRNRPRTNVNGPWGNNSDFSGPWNNGSSFSGPWDNNGSNFNMPWGNNHGSGMNTPWGNNNSSGMNMPWGNNNGSGMNMPWGNNSWGNNSWGNNRGYNNRGNNNGASFSMPWGNR